MHPLKLYFLVLLFILSTPSFAADVYKSVNKKGQTSYSNQPSSKRLPLVHSKTPSPRNTPSNWYHPAVGVTWQWQLLGAINQSYNVQIYDIDLFDTPAATVQQLKTTGKKVICYFSAGSYENWRSDAGTFAPATLGNNLDGWEGERWLDVRAVSVRNVMKARLDIAKQKGCDGVEPDNVDGYTNSSGFPLTAANQLQFNQFLATEAHARNLAIGLKNDLDQITALVTQFDFAVNEQCFEFAECSKLAPFIAAGKPVFNAEYRADYASNAATRANLCAQANALNFSTLVLPLTLDDSFRWSCR